MISGIYTEAGDEDLPSREKTDKLLLETLRKLVDMLAGALAYQQHLSQMAVLSALPPRRRHRTHASD